MSSSLNRPTISRISSRSKSPPVNASLAASVGRMMGMYFAMVSYPLSGRPWMTFSPGGRTAWAEIDTAGQLVQPDVPDLPVAQLESEVGAGGLAPPVRGRPGV